MLEPDTDQRLDVVRACRCRSSDSNVAYLKDATWVEKPARLFQQLLAETIRAGGTRLVVGESDLGYSAAAKLSGRLLDMGYDARTGSVVVRYDAVLQGAGRAGRDAAVREPVPGVEPPRRSVGPALNQAANQVAGEVADWVRLG